MQGKKELIELPNNLRDHQNLLLISNGHYNWTEQRLLPHLNTLIILLDGLLKLILMARK